MKAIISNVQTIAHKSHGFLPNIEEQTNTYTRLAYTNLGTGDYANRAIFEVVALPDGRFVVSAGYRTEDIDQQDGSEELGCVDGFFANCPHAKASQYDYIAVICKSQLQAVLEWALTQAWNIKTENDGWGGLHVIRAWLP